MKNQQIYSTFPPAFCSCEKISSLTIALPNLSFCEIM
jgi:hypothetical protein